MNDPLHAHPVGTSPMSEMERQLPPIQVMLAQKPDEYYTRVLNVVDETVKMFEDVDFPTKEDEIVSNILMNLVNMKKTFYTRFFFQVWCDQGVLKVHLKDPFNRLIPDQQVIERALRKEEYLFSEIEYEPPKLKTKKYTLDERLRQLAFVSPCSSAILQRVWGWKYSVTRYVAYHAEYVKVVDGSTSNSHMTFTLTPKGLEFVKEHGGPIPVKILEVLKSLSTDSTYKTALDRLFVHDDKEMRIVPTQGFRTILIGNIFTIVDKQKVVLTELGLRMKQLYLAQK